MFLHLATLFDLASQLDADPPPEPLMVASSLRAEWAGTVKHIEKALGIRL